MNFKRSYKQVNEWPKQWYDWSNSHPVDGLPESVEVEIDLEHVCLNPVPLQPASTLELIMYRVYLVSNEKAIVLIKG
jgi:hypothetical protein